MNMQQRVPPFMVMSELLMPIQRCTYGGKLPTASRLPARLEAPLLCLFTSE